MAPTSHQRKQKPEPKKGSGALRAAEDLTRLCLVSGEFLPKTDMIRFVADPAGVLTPDLEGRLPGRGLWVSGEKEVLEKAFKENPFSRAAKEKIVVPPDLLPLIDKLLVKRLLELLGLARGAGLVVVGQAQVEQSVKAQELAFLLVAEDAGGDGLKKLEQAGLPLWRASGREALGAALGHEQLVYLGLRPSPLAKKIEIELIRWQKAVFGAMKVPQNKEIV